MDFVLTMATERKVLVKHSEECCKIANDKFGYFYGLKLTLESLGFNKIGVDSILLKCRNRDFRELKEILKIIK